MDLLDEKERDRRKKLKYHKEYYRRTVQLNPTKVRRISKREKQNRKKFKITKINNERQVVLPPEQGDDKEKSEEKILGTNEE
jgi:hypothetical protein